MLSKWKTSLGIRVNPKIIGGIAQILFVSYIALHRLSIPNTEFIQGIFLGFSIVGNISMLILLRK